MKYRFHKYVNLILQQAQLQARLLGNHYVGSEHVLLSIMEDSTIKLSQALALQGIHYEQVKEDLFILFGLTEQKEKQIKVTKAIDDLMEKSIEIAAIKKKECIDIDIFCLALLNLKNSVAYGILQRYEVNFEKLIEYIDDELEDVLDSFSELRNMYDETKETIIVGREQELDFITNILCRKEKANPLLVGDPGVGKTAIIEYLAHKIKEKKVPKALYDVQIYELHLNTLVAGTKYRGDFEEKLQKIIDAVVERPNVILFIDEIHQMIGAGKSEGSIDVSSVFKPYLARGKLRLIGATTNDEYETFIEKDRALQRRFQKVIIKEPKEDACKKMLQSKFEVYQNFHQVHIDKEHVEEIIRLCKYYMPEYKFPDKAFDVLDLACVQANRLKQTELSNNILYQVVEQLTQIPLYTMNRIEELRKNLKETLCGQQSMIHSFCALLQWTQQKQLDEKPLAVIGLVGDQTLQKEQFLSIFSKTYLNVDSYLECHANFLQQQLPDLITQCKRHPYNLLYITNLQASDVATQTYVLHALKKGMLQFQQQQATLRHCIVIIDLEPMKTTQSLFHFQSEESFSMPLEECFIDGFMHLFDEVLSMEELTQEQQIQWLKQQVAKWNYYPNKVTIKKALKLSNSLEEAKKYLRQQSIKKVAQI